MSALPSASAAASPVVVAPGTRRPAGACTWEGTDELRLDLGQVLPVSGWEPRVRSESGLTLNGLVYKPDVSSGIDSEGSGELCFPVTMSTSGNYFFTMISYTPKRTDHNDMWVTTSKQLRMSAIRDSRTFDSEPLKYLKAFQNRANIFATSMKNKDRDGHRFEIVGVDAGVSFRVCISGRSSKFEIFALVLKRCEGLICEGRGMSRRDVLAVPVSQCV